MGDGGVRVVNRGYSSLDNKWKEAQGKAYFVRGSDRGHLKVSFFGPFYGSYIVFELDHDNYQYALVCGPDKSFFWLLARHSSIDEATMRHLIAKAQVLGFDTSRLIYVSQE
jgi:apolipoprotein D and lipocalin family protein